MGMPFTSRLQGAERRRVAVDGLAQAVEDAAEHVAATRAAPWACPVNSTEELSVERPVFVPKIWTATARLGDLDDPPRPLAARRGRRRATSSPSPTSSRALEDDDGAVDLREAPVLQSLHLL